MHISKPLFFLFNVISVIQFELVTYLFCSLTLALMVLIPWNSLEVFNICSQWIIVIYRIITHINKHVLFLSKRMYFQRTYSMFTTEQNDITALWSRKACSSFILKASENNSEKFESVTCSTVWMLLSLPSWWFSSPLTILLHREAAWIQKVPQFLPQCL